MRVFMLDGSYRFAGLHVRVDLSAVNISAVETCGDIVKSVMSKSNAVKHSDHYSLMVESIRGSKCRSLRILFRSL